MHVASLENTDACSITWEYVKYQLCSNIVKYQEISRSHTLWETIAASFPPILSKTQSTFCQKNQDSGVLRILVNWQIKFDQRGLFRRRSLPTFYSSASSHSSGLRQDGGKIMEPCWWGYKSWNRHSGSVELNKKQKEGKKRIKRNLVSEIDGLAHDHVFLGQSEVRVGSVIGLRNKIPTTPQSVDDAKRTSGSIMTGVSFRISSGIKVGVCCGGEVSFLCFKESPNPEIHAIRVWEFCCWWIHVPSANNRPHLLYIGGCRMGVRFE